MTTSEDELLRVSGKSSAQSTAAAIAHAIYEHGKCEVRAVGAGAVNQAVKAIAIARGYTAPRGIDLVCIPGFQNVESNGDKISAILFKVTTVN